VQLLALLLVAVVVPSACVLWFMNEAVESQAAATRVTLVDAYRGQLRLVRGRLNAYWERRVAELEDDLPRSPAGAFEHLVTSGAANSAIVLGPDSAPLYPCLVADPGDLASGDPSGSAAARAAQQKVRELVQAGQRRAAIDAINRHFISGPGARGLDADGRLIAADEQLLLIDLLPASDPRRLRAIGRLTALVNDYSTVRLRSAQRLFLMEQLRSIGSEASAGPFPTLDAERLAISFLETERPARAGAGLRPTVTRDVWQASSPGGRVVALYRASTVMRAMRALLDEEDSPAVDFRVIEPGTASDDEAVAIGSALPGWEVSFAMSDRSAAGSAPHGRRNSYVAIALLAIGAIATAAATLGGAARRQARLAALRTDLVSAVSHELKTPLAAMRLLVDALLEDVELDPAKTRDYLQLMSVENARLSRLIENFLTFSRLERNRYQFAFKPTNPADVVREALSAMPEGRRSDGASTVDIAPDLPSILADQDGLVTVLLNLLDNAYKYTPAEPRISLRVFRETDHVVFAVEDNGIGIPAREQKRIFRRFYRLDRRLARDTAGTGLGLSIVDGIVRAHGGRVRVRSEPGRGSTFAVYVPIVTGGAPG
jgi:signal transduction histidine kinase